MSGEKWSLLPRLGGLSFSFLLPGTVPSTIPPETVPLTTVALTGLDYAESPKTLGAAQGSQADARFQRAPRPGSRESDLAGGAAGVVAGFADGVSTVKFHRRNP